LNVIENFLLLVFFSVLVITVKEQETLVVGAFPLAKESLRDRESLLLCALDERMDLLGLLKASTCRSASEDESVIRHSIWCDMLSIDDLCPQGLDEGTEECQTEQMMVVALGSNDRRNGRCYRILNTKNENDFGIQK
jgi:hypothetical protein